MKATITINLDNAAFPDDSPSYELSRILRDISDNLIDGIVRPRIYDINGNAVGTFRITN